MYCVTCDDLIIYNDISLAEDLISYAPELNIGDNKAGTFKITLPESNRGYSKVTKHVSTIKITKDSNWLFEGRIIKESTNFQNQKTIECEGALAYLNDVVLPPKEYRANTIGELFSQVLAIYNERIKDKNPNRKINVGAITVAGNADIVDYESNYENVLEFITSNTVDMYGGHLFISRDNEGLKLNYYEDWLNTCDQTIDFGSNLIDFTRDYDFSNICTVCIPRGKQLSEEDTYDGTSDEKVSPSSRNKYLTIEEVNNGSIYLESNLVSTYGRIEKVVDFSDIEDPTQLLNLARSYMSSLQFQDLTMKVKAVDLHVLNPSIDSFDLLDQIRCVSIPHGLDRYFPISEIKLPLNQPESVEYTMGLSAGGITTSVSTTNSQVKSQLDKTSTRESVLVEAFRNAEAVLSTKTNGFVNIVDTGEYSQALIISNTKDWKTSTRYWKFDVNGLGHYVNNRLQGIAITMDGQIVADRITTGTMSADRIRTGTIKDIYNNNIINLETGRVYLNATKTLIETAAGYKYLNSTLNEINKHTTDIVLINQKQATFQTDINGLKANVTEMTKTISTIETKQASITMDIDSIETSVKSLKANYGTCSTSASVQTKQVTCADFKLEKGAVVVVKFTYKNTANLPRLNVNSTGSSYIRVNDSYLYSNSKENWGAGQTVNFVYSGTYWMIADGSTESHIRQLADSISLSVTGKLGSSATIKLEADGDIYQDYIDMTGVRTAFRDDRSTIKISAGQVEFDAGTFVLKSRYCSIDSMGNLDASNAILQGTLYAQSGDKEIRIDAGSMGCYKGGSQVGCVEPGRRTWHIPDQQYYATLVLQSIGIIRLHSSFISVIDDPDTSETAILTITNEVEFVQNIVDLGEGEIEWHYGEAHFINGLCTYWS